MPIYVYKCNSCGATKEVRKPMSEFDTVELCDVDSFVMLRDILAEHGKFQDTAGNWPMKCDASGVAASQAQEAMEHADSIGVPTHFDSEGRPTYRSRGHRKQYLEAIGMYDKSGGYSDPQRK